MTAPARECQPGTESLPERLRAACDGHPHAKIDWPHRILHEAADRIDFAEFEWNRATEGMQERDARIATLQARVEELERILREARRFIDPDCDPSALTNRALTLQINRALAPSLERSGGAT